MIRTTTKMHNIIGSKTVTSMMGTTIAVTGGLLASPENITVL